MWTKKPSSELLPTPKTFPQILATSLKLPPHPPLSFLPYTPLLSSSMTTAHSQQALNLFFFLFNHLVWVVFIGPSKTKTPLIAPVLQLYLLIFNFHYFKMLYVLIYWFQQYFSRTWSWSPAVKSQVILHFLPSSQS